ncbi:S8 family serine peptidase [Halorientalis halophila]|uniref:S8 family serine peptidase n=1 Tax=Halorientalis halophila TaxID=3108499 RepID=UPI0030095ED7
MDEATAVGRRDFLAAAGGTAAAVGATGTGGATVDPDLAAKSGRVDAVVRLEAVSDTDSRGERGEVVRTLRDRASRTQQRVVDYVRDTPGMELRRRFWLANAVLVRVDTDRAAFADLAAIDGVDRVHRTGAGGGSRPAPKSTAANGPVSESRQADDGISYGLEMMNVPAVWDRFETRGEGARVAVIDTGVDAAHPDIDLAAWAEFDAEGERVDSDPHDPHGHGTGMSSLAVGGDASGTQIGVAPDAELIVARQSQDGIFASTIAALEWAVEKDADVVSMSFEFGPLEHEAIEPIANAIAAGTVVVPATVGSDYFFAPGSFYHALSVGAVDRDRDPFRDGNGGEILTERHWRSDLIPENWPDRYTVPDVVTAGYDVLTAVPDNEEFDGGHQRTNGYSNGPPHVAGVVALLRSLDPDLAPAEIQRLLTETAEQPGDPYEYPETNGDFGHGVVNAAAAAAELVGRNREVTGTVTDPGGEPVANAAVTAVTGDATRTDGQGRYSLSVPPGDAAVTASAVGYESVRRRVAPGAGRDLAFETERRPDVQRTARPPTVFEPGDTISMAFQVEHADNAGVFVRESPVALDASAVSVTIDGESAELGRPVRLADGTRTLRIEIAVADGTRGVLPLTVGVAAESERPGEPVTTRIELDTIHVHERPMLVAEGEDLQAALDSAAPGTFVKLAGDRWERQIEAVDASFPASRYDVPIFEESRDDEAALVLDRPITVAAEEGSDPTLVASGGSGERRFGVQITSHYVRFQGIEVVADGATAAVSVLDGDGVHLQDLDLSGADHGIFAQFTKSLTVQYNRIAAAATGVTLRDFSVNALVRENEIRDAERGVVLSGRVGDRLLDVDADVFGNSFENVATELDVEGTTTVRGEDGEERGIGSPPGDSTADLLLYAATAAALGVLLYPYGRRRFR